MKSYGILVCLLAIGTVSSGCISKENPMPARLSDEQQTSFDDAWDKTLTPVGRFDGQTLLDILVTTQAYRTGIDKIDFRSEKRISNGKVVMEIHFDRALPGKDRFDVEIFDATGASLRRETYDREWVDRTYRELFVEVDKLDKKRAENTATPEELALFRKYEARVNVVISVFPKPPKDEKPNLPRK